MQCAFAVDDELAVADEGEVLIHVVIAAVGAEHQLEAAGIVRRLGAEGVARGLEQVNIVAGEVVDEVQVAKLDFLIAKAEGIAAVFS